ncbi:MAG: hypothetical protein IJE10_09140 [Clostridia bacterium]|nr:hypothetical protein [Clostridia bacterium]
MEMLKFDLNKAGQKFKILNATNGGPWHKRHTDGQNQSNFEAYKAARIPYSRNHDSGVVSVYGGPYSHDITKIFPFFDADVHTPESYDFPCTDESVLVTLDAGTQTFFRLGQTIEHHVVKHGANPPKDFQKWAEICEHIIRHYNQGWANGFELGMEYWEIWNEPDVKGGGCWTGTDEQFFDLFETAAKHLKKCFPNIKIGGPAIAFDVEWGERFLKEMQARGVELDFFSWHCYCTEPNKMMARATQVREMMNHYGYGNAESILNEWNYVKGWTDEYIYSIQTMHGIKGATFTMACISEAQKNDGIDMLMYYDTRPSVFCGAFDFYTTLPLKGYYPLYWYGMFYDLTVEIRCENQPEKIYTLCGKDEQGKVMCIVTYYDDHDENAPSKEVNIDFGKEGKYEIYLLDAEHDGTFAEITDNLTFKMDVCSSILIKEV